MATWQYAQFAVLFLVALAVGGGLVWRSRLRSGSLGGGPGGAASVFRPIPVHTAGGAPQPDENWGWHGEEGGGEDHVQLLAGEKGLGLGVGHHSKGNSTNSKKGSIYALARSPPTAAAGGPPASSSSSMPSPQPARRESGAASAPVPLDVDQVFAEMGMEAKPDFTSAAGVGGGMKTASLQRKGSASPPRPGSATRSSRLSAAMATGSPVKGGSGSGGWEDDDLDI
jgi:hypothetical protein